MSEAERVTMAFLLHQIADEQNDARDHDEHHAAADALQLGLSTPYIDRWISGLLVAYKRELVPTP